MRVNLERGISAPPIRPDSKRQRWVVCRRLILSGAGLVFFGSFFPWATGVYGGQPFSWNGWDLYYLHWPHFTAGLMPLSFAVAAAGIATIAARRPSMLTAAPGPGFLLCGFLAFTYATSAPRPFGASSASLPGSSSSYLGQ